VKFLSTRNDSVVSPDGWMAAWSKPFKSKTRRRWFY